MEKETTIILPNSFKIKEKKNITKFVLCGFGIILLFNVILFFVYNKMYKNLNQILFRLFTKEIFKKLNKIENLLNNIEYKQYNSKINESEEFNEIIMEKIEENQNNFCLNTDIFYNQEIETMIQKLKVTFHNFTFEIFAYKTKDIISQTIQKTGKWDIYGTNNLLEALNFYSKKNHLSEKDVYVLDIGANIGWYSYSLGKFGYKIISFEPSKFNNYILKKNYCFNKDINITIINKGFNIREKNCFLCHTKSNFGNSILICDEKINKIYKNNYLIEEISFTKLNNYISFLSDKNLALIKIDIEGSEEKAIISGKDLIIKYHIPFIYMEFTPKFP